MATRYRFVRSQVYLETTDVSVSRVPVPINLDSHNPLNPMARFNVLLKIVIYADADGSCFLWQVLLISYRTSDMFPSEVFITGTGTYDVLYI